MGNILCLLGLHKDEFKEELVYEEKDIEAYNVWYKCKRCGRETEKEGTTHFKII